MKIEMKIIKYNTTSHHNGAFKSQTNREKFKNGYHTFKRPNKKLA